MLRFLTALLFSLASAAGGTAQLPARVLERFGTPPPVPAGALSPALAEAVQLAFVESVQSNGWGPDQWLALEEVAASGDPRLAWHMTDQLRFASRQDLSTQLTLAAATLLHMDPPVINQWGVITDQLIAWDIPAPPNYLAIKRALFARIVPQWQQILQPGDADWRLVSWGGVNIDDRPFDTTDDPCYRCIPAADNPPVTTADQATWLDDEAIVFGLVVNGEARAYPRRIMEVRELVNDSLGGRDLGIPYCTLCGSAQAYFTDALPPGIARPVLRTSGLLVRSNKVMYDLETFSVLDTFKGTALTGPLAEAGLVLPQASIITTRWGQWKQAYPETTVLAERLALGRDPDFRSGRDANGPIFPIGPVDPRLPVHEDIVGLITPSGRPIAFPQAVAVAALQRGEDLVFEGGRLILDAGGVKAVDAQGRDLGSHQAFWFAWSQFHKDTLLWQGTALK